MNKMRPNTLSKNNGARHNIAITLLFIVITIFAVTLSIFNFGSLKANALTIPDDYGTGYTTEETIDNLAVNDSFEGILCNDKENKQYTLQVTSEVNGLVTLARISHNSSLEGYTFAVNYGGLITLKVNYEDEESTVPLSAGSFFGIGNDAYPFKGTLTIGGGQDTAVTVAQNGWRYLFNNLSNQGSIISNGRILYSTNVSTTSEAEEANSFVFAKKLTITANNQALDVSGWRFGSSAAGTLAHGSGLTALFASEVAAGTGNACTIDLSSCFTENTYTVVSDDDDAAGLIARVNDGVNLTVKLPASLNCSVTSGGSLMNAGILIGTNLGTVTFIGDGVSTLSGKVECSGSAGLIGANNIGSSGQLSKAVFDAAVTVDGLRAKGLRAGGIIGTNKGILELSDVSVTKCTLTKITNSTLGRMGGVVGSIDNANGGIVLKEGASVSISNNAFSFSDSCYIGGYVGYWNSNGATVERVNVQSATISCNGLSGAFGGYIGSLQTSGDFTVNLNSTSVIAPTGLTVGVYGGVIGQITSSAIANTVLIEGDGVETCTLQNNLTDNGTNAVAGGVVGRIGESTYVKVNNLTLNNAIVKIQGNDVRYVNTADVAGSIQANGVLDIGNLTLNDTQGSVLVGTTGVGSVVRLGGTITDNSTTVNNIVFQQDSSLIYKDSGCVYSGAASYYNDIASYGQVIRNDTLGIISMDENTHAVSIASPLTVSGDIITLSGTADFAKLSITFYTQGIFSGVDGITSENYTDLLSKTINLTGNVDLTNTGIEQLTRPDSNANPFTGTFNGNGNTVTMAIGQSLLDDTNNGDTDVYNGYNKRAYQGLFAALSGAAINNLKIDGLIHIGVYYKAYHVGSLAGYATGGLTVDGCTISTKITLDSIQTSNIYPFTDIGGLVGVIENATSLTVRNNRFGAEISDTVPYSASYLSRYFWGGLSGQVSYKGSSKIDFTNNIITTSLTKTEKYSYLKTGGLIAVLSCTNYTEVDLDGTCADVSLTASGVTGNVGGILGYSFTNCHLNNLNGTYKGIINAGSATLGGLVHTLTGRLTIADGFSLGESTFTTTKTNAEDCGMLLADGRNAFVSVACPASAFASVTADGFDLLVGQNVSSYTSVDVAEYGGIVTIETVDDLGKVPLSSDWFTAINARQNDKTRYYFNILKLSQTNATTTEQKLLLWHVYSYSCNNVSSVVIGEWLGFLSMSVNFTATSDADMTGYCFYPTQRSYASTINFNNHSLTFATPTSATAKQFYGMQAGLIADIDGLTSDITVTLQNIKLCGTVANLGDNKGSGAFICGKANGNVSSSDSTVFSCNITVSNVILDGLKVDGSDGYRPLLINTMGSYTNATITNISQSGYADGDNAACSLIGCGGVEESSGTNSTYLNVTLQGITLNGSETSIFTNSTLFYDVKYISATSSVIYTFNFAEDWGEGTPHAVTYGAELYFDEEQQKYFDCEIFVNPVTLPDESSSLYNFSLYLPYVFVGYNADGGSTNRYLIVNRKGADFIEGWGTYENPYIITSPKQLIDLSIWLSGTSSFNEGWQINIPKGVADSTSDFTGYYLFEMTGGTLVYTIDEDNKKELSTTVLLEYLAGAYYKIGDIDLTLTSDFVGLGSTSYPFHGVVHGNNKTLTLASPSNAIGEAGYGFVNVANGCAIYGLTISYGDIALSTANLTSSMTATSAPNAETLATSMPHFGGAIAWVVGGDNQINGVTVTVDSVSGSCNTAFGNYVGLISGGGVLLSDLGEVGGYNSNTNIYHNNYIGRVLNGYAIAIDGVTYNNGKNANVVTNLVADFEGDFKIPTLSLNNITAHSAGFNGTNAFTIGNEEELLMLSYALNSGALHSTTGYAYGQNALSRYGDYSKVGATVTGIADGKYTDDTFAVALPARYFGIEAQTALSSTQLDIKLTATAYDMTSYGNGFRGMSGTYSDSFIYKIKSFGNDSAKATIKVNMNMPQYGYINTGSDKPTGDIYDKDSIASYGLFGRTSCAVTFKNLVLTGNICVTTIDYSNVANYYTKSPGYNVGGLIGQNNSSNSITVNNVSMKGFTVVSPNCAGGLVGYFSGGTLTVNNTVGSDLSQDVLIKGQKNVGGCLGYLYKQSTANITGFEIADSTVEAVQRYPKNSSDQQTGIGGVIGGAGAYNANPTFTNCAVTKTAVVLYASYNATNNSIASGGLLGTAGDNGSITATGCTVDGCVVLSLGNFSGNNFPYETFIGSDSTVAMLSDDIKNNLLYNGENQSSLKVLAYFLERSNSSSEYNGSSGYSIGSAGGLLGSVSKKVTLSDCTVTAKSAPMMIASLNDSAGLIGENRANVTLTVSNCTVSTQGHDMYIMGASRSAGIMAYGKFTSNGISVTNCNVVGAAENPIRMVQFMYNNAEASGLFGDLGIITNLTATNCRVSYCIIAGVKASAIHTTTRASSGTLKNIHVDNNVIYSRNSYAGGLFNEYTATYSLEGVYLANNYIIGYTGAGGLAGTATSNSLSGKYVIMDNNTVCKGNQASNYTFATSDLTDGSVASTLYNTASPSFTNTGLIAGNNTITIKLYAVSCSLPESITTRQTNFGAGSSTSSFVIYNAYGAGEEYAGYTAEYSDKTPQQLAIEARNYSATTADGSAIFYGDSVTAGTPATIADLPWWVSDRIIVGTETIQNLSAFVDGVTVNTNLQLFCFNENADENLAGYLNMLTGGGFGALTEAKSSLISISSCRYRVASDGSITALSGNGSVIYSYNNVNNAYAFKVVAYDNLESDRKTFTVLSITFNEVYTMHIPIYYHKSVNLKTFVMPVEGEQYYMPLFTSSSEPIGSIAVNASYGSSFTLYIEYNYNSVSQNVEAISNFNKRLEMVNSSGQSDANAKIESGTVFVLLDLNSATPSGYSFYTLTLTEDKQYVNFIDFKNGEEGFAHVNLTDLTTISSSLCKDTEEGGCIYTERYLLVVFPVAGSGNTNYNIKAIIDEEQRQETNIAVRRLVEVYGQVTIWEKPTMTNDATYVDGSAEGINFSYQAGDTIKLTVENTINYPEGYVGTLQGQGGAVYETHFLQILDSTGKAVELPQRTIVKVTGSDDSVIYYEQLSASSQVYFSLGDVLTKPNKSYTVEIDFSHVNYNDFRKAFTGTESTDYTVMDRMYLSTAEGVLGIGPTSAKLTFNVKRDAKIKLAVVPDKDSLSNLCINLAQNEISDETNSGVIDFSLNAMFDSSSVSSAEISFAVSKKVYNSTLGKYEYVALSEAEADIWTVYKDATAVTGDSLSVADNEASGSYRLVVNKNSTNLKLTNYCLTVTLTADDGTVATDYFVFLVCNINVEIS